MLSSVFGGFCRLVSFEPVVEAALLALGPVLLGEAVDRWDNVR